MFGIMINDEDYPARSAHESLWFQRRSDVCFPQFHTSQHVTIYILVARNVNPLFQAFDLPLTFSNQILDLCSIKYSE